MNDAWGTVRVAHCDRCAELGHVHLVVPNPRLRDEKGRARIGCWNTVMLTACGQFLEPQRDEHVYAAPRLDDRHVTVRLDLATCPGCLAWAADNTDLLRDDGHGHQVTR